MSDNTNPSPIARFGKKALIFVGSVALLIILKVIAKLALAHFAHDVIPWF
jgi:hypothetical protein